VAAALIEAGAWPLDMTIVWGVVLLGLGLAFMIEWRTVGQHGGSTRACPEARRLTLNCTSGVVLVTQYVELLRPYKP
jgi:hypothetical protein